jgi:hypothetical protein
LPASQRRVTLAATVVAAVAAALGGIVPASAGAASLGGLSVRPAHFDAAHPTSRAYFTRAVAPGGSFSDAVIVSNTSSTPLSVYVYPVDGLTGATSGAVYANRQDGRRKAAKWLRMTTTQVTVPAHRQLSVAFAVHVPRSAKAGDNLAGIAVENARPIRSGGKFSVTEVMRAVVGVLVTVPGAAKPVLQLDTLALQPLPGTPLASVVVTLADTGRKLCKPTLSISLDGRTVQRQLDTILPGDRIAFPFPWPQRLGAGTHNATARAFNCGAPTAVRATARLGASLSGPGATPAHSPGAKAGTTPWWPMPLVAIGGLLAGTLFARRGSRGGGSEPARSSGA